MYIPAQRASVTSRRPGPRAGPDRQHSNSKVHDPTQLTKGANQPSPPPLRPQRFFVWDFFSCVCVPAARPQRNQRQHASERATDGRTDEGGSWSGPGWAGGGTRVPAASCTQSTPNGICHLPARPSGITPPRTHAHAFLSGEAAVTSHRLTGWSPPTHLLPSLPFIYPPSLPL